MPDWLLSNGFIQSSDYPAPIDRLNISADIQNNTSGKMNDFIVDLSQFGFVLEDESINGRLKVNDFNLLNWDGAINGTVDFGKDPRHFPYGGHEYGRKDQCGYSDKRFL
jgi:hypothetical protein